MEKLDDFQRIIVLKCLRPDKITDAMQDYVATHIGQRFIEPQVIKIYINDCNDSNNTGLKDIIHNSILK